MSQTSLLIECWQYADCECPSLVSVGESVRLTTKSTKERSDGAREAWAGAVGDNVYRDGRAWAHRELWAQKTTVLGCGEKGERGRRPSYRKILGYEFVSSFDSQILGLFTGSLYPIPSLALRPQYIGVASGT